MWLLQQAYHTACPQRQQTNPGSSVTRTHIQTPVQNPMSSSCPRVLTSSPMGTPEPTPGRGCWLASGVSGTEAAEKEGLVWELLSGHTGSVEQRSVNSRHIY